MGESPKATNQKATYTSPSVLNVVSRRTMSRGVQGAGGKFRAQSGISARAEDLRRMNNYGSREANDAFFRNQARIARAEANMLRRTNNL